jgi:hypothetical protein
MPADTPKQLNGSARMAVRRALVPLLAAAATVALVAPAAQADTANFAGASSDGSRVFFATKGKLVPGDTDRGFADIYERSFDAEPGIEDYVTRELSTGPTGGNDAYPASNQGASADGGEVFFSTQEPLVSADRDRAVDLYARNTATGATTLLSPAGTCPEGAAPGACDPSFRGASSDGSRVFFTTGERLSAEDTDSAADLYVWEEGAVSLVSTSPTATGGETAAAFAGASANGERVFFETEESLVPADTDPTSDIYMRDLEDRQTTLVTPGGTCPEGLSPGACFPNFKAASADGARVFFTTSEQLSSEDTDSAADLYVWEEGAVSLVSTGPTATGDDTKPATFAGSRDNGGLVFFETGEKLTSADSDGAVDVYVRDLDAESPTTTLVSQGDPSCVEAGSCGAGGGAANFKGASADGETAFIQTAEKLAPEDDDARTDVYARAMSAETTTLVSRPSSACEGEACGPPEAAVYVGASTDGTVVFFRTKEPLVPEDTESEDVYRRDLGAGTTTLESAAGECPLPVETGCDANFRGASEDGSRVFFVTARRLDPSDVDSDEDLYEREGSETRLVSTGNSIELGPETPVLTGLVPGAAGETLTPSVRGRAPSETSIKVYATSDCSGEAVVGTAEELVGAGIEVTVEAGTTTPFTATATDATGTTSSCSNVLDYTQEAAAPPSEEEGGSGTGGGGAGTGGAGTGGTGGSGGGAPGGSGSGGRGGSGSGPGGIAYVAPVSRITFGPAFKTRARRPVFRFVDATGQPGTSFICRLDRRRWRPCSSPLRLKHLRRGRHVLRVKAENAVGEWEQRPTRRAFKLVRRGGHRRHGRHRRSGRR